MKRPVGLIIIIVSSLFAAISLIFAGSASAATCSPNFFWDRSKPYGITNDQKTAQIYVSTHYTIGGWNPINAGNIVCGIFHTNERDLVVFNGNYGKAFDSPEVIVSVGIQVSGGSTQGQTSTTPQSPTKTPTPPPPDPLQAPPDCSSSSSPDPSASPQSTSPPQAGQVLLSANVAQITAGSRANVYGYVADTNGCAMPGAQVSLMYIPYGGSEYELQSLTSDSQGRFSRYVAPPKLSKFRAVSESVTSDTFILGVARRVSVASPAGNTRISSPATFRGVISPAFSGLYVGFSRWQIDKWVYFGHAQTNSLGQWLTRFNLPKGGLTLRMYAPAYAGNSIGESIIRIVVS